MIDIDIITILTLPNAFTSAPLSNNSSAQDTCPLPHAWCNGELPSYKITSYDDDDDNNRWMDIDIISILTHLSLAFTSAPLANKSSAHDTWPLPLA